MKAMTTKKNPENEWLEVANGVSVHGTAERFGINWFGAVIYGCRIIDGKNGKFIGFPTFRGKDGKRVKSAYVYAERGSEDEQILNAIVELLTKD